MEDIMMGSDRLPPADDSDETARSWTSEELQWLELLIRLLERDPNLDRTEQFLDRLLRTVRNLREGGLQSP
jgi:hypothetical protein